VNHPPKLSLAEHYHDRTKYHPETIGRGGVAIDWDRPPETFKTYQIGTTIELQPYLKRESENLEASDHFLRRLSRLLYLTYGVTAKMQGMGSQVFYLRTAPSAGGLYPAEIYLISRGMPDLPAGLYNYQVKTHSLHRFWESDVWPGLQTSCIWHPSLETTRLAIVTTAVFFRSFWRYHDRAYRRIYLDTGHLLGNLELASSLNDYRVHAIGGFRDQALNDLLYLDGEREAATAVFALADRYDLAQDLPSYATALPSGVKTDYPDLAEGHLLAHLHQASEIDTEPRFGWETIATNLPSIHNRSYDLPFCTKVSTDTPPIDWGLEASDLERSIVNRRSCRRYSPKPISIGDLKAILDFAYHPERYHLWALDPAPDYFDLPSIRTFVAVSHVEDLEAGCYYYAPEADELRQIRFKNFRRELHFLALNQDLARDAGAVIFHTADLGQAIARYGDRAYRYLHLDAGHLGQRLNLAAVAIGLGASGIAGFFDDHVNEVLGIPPAEAVLYLTTIGQPFGRDDSDR
jgi:SagB-type dehydrogenase family enzyme